MQSPIRETIPPAEFFRYAAVGVWNTVFGYALYALLTFMLMGKVRFAFLLAAALAHVINISVAFIGYKFFVFRSKGNFFKEYLRAFAVYGVAAGVNLALLPLAVAVVQALTQNPASAPYIGGGILTFVTAVVSFIGHKRFSFAPDRSER